MARYPFRRSPDAESSQDVASICLLRASIYFFLAHRSFASQVLNNPKTVCRGCLLEQIGTRYIQLASVALRITHFTHGETINSVLEVT
jgi:hypothetical protein